MKRKRVFRIFSLLLALCVVLLGGILWFLQLSPFALLQQSFPQKPIHVTDHALSYSFPSQSYFERQGKNECAGFTTAYLMRLMGNEETGKQVYDTMELTFYDGYVLPQAILDYFDAQGVAATMYSGELQSLFSALDGGLPVIALVGNGPLWQHYVTVVGYDEENIYLYDSNRSIEGATTHNRTLLHQDFLNIWSNKIPVFNHLYFEVDRL